MDCWCGPVHGLAGQAEIGADLARRVGAQLREKRKARGMSLDELAGHAARIGYRGIDLLGPEDWAAPRKHGLVCPLAMLGAPVFLDEEIENSFAVDRHGVYIVSDVGMYRFDLDEYNLLARAQ